MFNSLICYVLVFLFFFLLTRLNWRSLSSWHFEIETIGLQSTSGEKFKLKFFFPLKDWINYSFK
jgi:hypothetical protein